VPSSAIGSVLESILGTVLVSILVGILRSRLGGCTVDHTRRSAWEHLESLLQSIQLSRLGVCHRVQLGVDLRACSGV